MKRPPLIESPVGAEALAQLCGPDDLRPDTVRGLVDAVRAQTGRQRRRGLFDQFDALLSHDD